MNHYYIINVIPPQLARHAPPAHHPNGLPHRPDQGTPDLPQTAALALAHHRLPRLRLSEVLHPPAVALPRLHSL